MVCLIEMSGKMLGSMLEMVQKAEMPSLTQNTICMVFTVITDTVIIEFKPPASISTIKVRPLAGL